VSRTDVLASQPSTKSCTSVMSTRPLWLRSPSMPFSGVAELMASSM
jgi:hypothetical protein